MSNLKNNIDMKSMEIIFKKVLPPVGVFSMKHKIGFEHEQKMLSED